MLLLCVLFDAIVERLFDNYLLLRLTFVELFALDVFCFFVDDILRISLIDVLLIE